MPRRGGSICSPESLVAVQSQPFIRGGSSGAVVGEDHGPKRREVLEAGIGVDPASTAVSPPPVLQGCTGDIYSPGPPGESLPSTRSARGPFACIRNPAAALARTYPSR